MQATLRWLLEVEVEVEVENLCGAAGHVARDERDEILAQAGADCHSHTHLRKRQGGVEVVGRMEGLEGEKEEKEEAGEG